MAPTEIRDQLRREPFEPFRLHVTDGAHYDILHPETCMVGLRTTAVGVPASPESVLWDRLVQVDNLHITRIEPIPRPSPNSQTNGPPN